jgi:hypothetical protein
MGWGSATGLFDGAVTVALKFAPDNELMKHAVVHEMYTKINWDDWDTQDESKYFDQYLIHVMYELGEIEKDYYDEYLSRTVS